jgi:hypothetical protein
MKWTSRSLPSEVDEEVQSHEVDEKVGLYEWLFSLQLEHSTRDQVRALATGVVELVAVVALDFGHVAGLSALVAEVAHLAAVLALHVVHVAGLRALLGVVTLLLAVTADGDAWLLSV